MDHYQDIRILPDPDFSTPMLMNAMFAKLHRALVQLNSSAIAVSFPKVEEKRPSLGNVLRLHGKEENLKTLLDQNWLKGMRDHLVVKEINTAPADAQHCRVRRVQVKSNAQRLRRRYRSRHEDATDADLVSLILESAEKRSDLPYLQLKSTSNGQSFLFFLEHQKPQVQAIAGEFNCYGLSGEATVPWF